MVALAAFSGWLALMLAPANRMNVSRAAGGLNALATNYQAALTMPRLYIIRLRNAVITINRAHSCNNSAMG